MLSFHDEPPTFRGRIVRFLLTGTSKPAVSSVKPQKQTVERRNRLPITYIRYGREQASRKAANQERAGGRAVERPFDRAAHPSQGPNRTGWPDGAAPDDDGWFLFQIVEAPSPIKPSELP